MKPKAIGYILLSYFQQNFLTILGSSFAILILLVGSLQALTNPAAAVEKIESTWNTFLMALLFILFVSGLHMKGLIGNNATALLPHYRRYLLMALGLVLVAFLVWPVVITALRGFPVLPSLAMFLFLSCLVMGGIFFFGESVIVLGGMIWLGKLVYEMLGFKSKVKIFGDFSDFSLLGSKSVFPILVILLSGILLYLFALYLLKAPADFSIKKTDISNPYTKDYDRRNILSTAITKRYMVLLLKNNQDKKRSLFYIARLLQPALFSPGYVSFTQSLLGIIIIISYLGTLIYILLESKIDPIIIPLSLIIYYMSAAMITTDFLQHRQRMPRIWMQAQLDSRKAFAKATILTYIIVMVKNHLALSSGLLIIPVFFPEITVLRLLPLIILGFLVYIILLSLSLLNSHLVISPECKGWMLFHIIIIIPTLGLFIRHAFQLPNTPGTWIFLMVLVVITGLLLWWAYKKWSNTELNFTGPRV